MTEYQRPDGIKNDTGVSCEYDSRMREIMTLLR